MKNFNNYTESQLNTLIHLLTQEFAVLSRIDLNSDLEANNQSFLLKSSKENFINKKKFIALEMSKKISYACYIVSSSIYQDVSKEDAKKALLEVLKTDFDHPYCISALWNLNAMYNILNNDSNN